MSSQPVPNVSDADVARIVRRDFPPTAVDDAMSVVEAYGREAWEREPARVRLAALKLANGDVSELRRHITVAKTDYRDVLAAAEYPAAVRQWLPTNKQPPNDEQKTFDADWEQYRRWFERNEEPKRE